MEDTNKEKCNHSWIPYPTYQQCSICGEIIMDSEMSNVQGIISEDDADFSEEVSEDEKE